eukprot:jgi/Botrbrau1/22636/Bobra.176_1s0061.1
MSEVTPCSFEALVRHRAQHTEPSESIYIFHTHNYFNPDDPNEVELGKKFRRDLQEKFKDNREVEVHDLLEKAAGPHPWGNFEVLFTRNGFTDVITWTMLNRPDSMSVLCHPITTWKQADDHSRNTFWLGKQLPLKVEILQWYDEIVEAERADVPTEKILWAQAVHVDGKIDPDMMRAIQKAKAVGLI